MPCCVVVNMPMASKCGPKTRRMKGVPLRKGEREAKHTCQDRSKARVHAASQPSRSRKAPKRLSAQVPVHLCPVPPGGG